MVGMMSGSVVGLLSSMTVEAVVEAAGVLDDTIVERMVSSAVDALHDIMLVTVNDSVIGVLGDVTMGAAVESVVDVLFMHGEISRVLGAIMTLSVVLACKLIGVLQLFRDSGVG